MNTQRHARNDDLIDRVRLVLNVILLVVMVIAVGAGAGYLATRLFKGAKAEAPCIPADAVEETPRSVVDAWYAARCNAATRVARSRYTCGE